jgi:DNA-binding NarL/FixJ family response regulator
MSRALVVDDHPLFRAALAAVVAGVDGVDQVDEAPDGERALELAARETPDVVLLDLGLPGASGLDVLRSLRALDRPPAVLVVTMSSEAATVRAAMSAGARGYVLKGAAADELAAAIRAVLVGGVVLGGGVESALSAPTPGVDNLTAREREVLDLLAEGLGNKQIARRLGISLKTVQNHVSHLVDKLQVADRTQAALAARQRTGG